MEPDLSTCCHEGAHCTERMIRVHEQVSLRVYCFTQATVTTNKPVVMVGGFSTIIYSLRKIIRELTRDFPVFYIETREKPSSVISGIVSYGIPAMGSDLVTIIGKLGLEDGNYILMGNSFGATAIADGFSNLEAKPRFILFMQPTPVFHYPGWSLVLIRGFGVSLSHIIRPLAIWYLTRFRINRKGDPEMVKISAEALKNADPRKLRNTVLAIANYQVWDRLGTITCPVLIIAASKDSFHYHDEITGMVSMIPDCSLIDLETNDRTHGTEMALIITSLAEKYFKAPR